MVRQLVAKRVKTEARTPECLDDDTIAALAEGSLDAAAHQAVLPHLAGCARCRGAVASVARALSDVAVAREAASVEAGRRRRFYKVVLPAAAAAILLVVMWPRLVEEGRPHRAPPSAVQTPVPVSPIGAVADAPVLRWTRVPGADRYRLTLFDARGQVLYETQLGDSVVGLPDSIVLAPGRSYLWKVEARTGWDRWSASPLVQFSIARGPPR